MNNKPASVMGGQSHTAELTELQIMLAIDTLDAGDLRAFVTQTQEPSVGLSIRAEVRDDCVLRGICGYGDSFEATLRDLWRQLTVLEDPKTYLVVNAGRDTRRALRWNGVGFKPVFEPNRAKATGESAA